MNSVIQGTQEVIAYDLGQFLFKVNPDMTWSEVRDHVYLFIETFNVQVNFESTPIRDQFFINVGRGYHAS